MTECKTVTMLVNTYYLPLYLLPQRRCSNLHRRCGLLHRRGSKLQRRGSNYSCGRVTE